MKTALHKKIMRRVYYIYTLGFFEDSMMWQGFVLGACIALFGRLTHVASIINNFLSVPIGSVPTFILNSFEFAFVHGEYLTAIVVLAMAGFSISFIVKTAPILFRYRLAV